MPHMQRQSENHEKKLRFSTHCKIYLCRTKMETSYILICIACFVVVLGLFYIEDWLTRIYHYKHIQARYNNELASAYQATLKWFVKIMHLASLVLLTTLVTSELKICANISEFAKKKPTICLIAMGLTGLFVSVLGIVQYHIMGKETEGQMYTFADSGKHVLFWCFTLLLSGMFVWNIHQKSVTKKHQPRKSAQEAAVQGEVKSHG